VDGLVTGGTGFAGAMRARQSLAGGRAVRARRGARRVLESRALVGASGDLITAGAGEAPKCSPERIADERAARGAPAVTLAPTASLRGGARGR